MMKIVKWLFGIILVACCASTVFALIVFPPTGRIPVLMYHYVVPSRQVGPTSLDVSLEKFELQMWLLKKLGIRPITVDEFYAIRNGKQKPFGKQIVITFDDGNESYQDYALSVLDRYQFPSANFMTWTFLVKHQHGSMDLKHAKEVAKNPLVTIGSHTLNHLNLTDIDGKKAWKEIKKSKSKLERAFRRKINYFCYPSGVFTQRDIELVQKAGYLMAFTTKRKRLAGQAETDCSVTRFKIHSKDNLFVFWLKASGIASYWEDFKDMFRRLTVKDRNDTLIKYV
jgi:peptidoglycan/xylan/chitin deacetylase (PgdA/CDA1 family)